MTIKYIVLPGGGPALGLVEYGILKELSKKNILNYENIKSIYTCSIGSFFALIYILNYDWEWIDDFLIKRPWEKLINFDTNDYLNIFNTKGLLDETLILNCLKPLLLAKNLSINITLKELYEYSKIDLYIYSTELNNLSKVELSYKTHPDLSIIKAITMSCCIPFLFKPVYYNNNYYLDGGICVNNPTNECILKENCKYTELLVIENDKKNPIDTSNNFYINNDYNNNDEIIDLNSLNIFSYLILIIKKIFFKISSLEIQNNIKSNLSINASLNSHAIDLKYWYHVTKTRSERIYLIDLGIKCVDKFILDNSNIILDNSNNLLDNSNNLLDNSNIILDNSNIILDNSNIILDNRNNLLDNSNNLLDNSNNLIDNSNNLLDNSNNLLDNSN